ncbi:MAG: hypothetical protein LBP85_10370, partial [Prevotellaceae bacterium]|nr:hypothetical protein [Prevotellaceae bacterium]
CVFYRYSRIFACLRPAVAESDVPCRQAICHHIVAEHIAGEKTFLSGSSPSVFNVLRRISDNKCIHSLH